MFFFNLQVTSKPQSHHLNNAIPIVFWCCCLFLPRTFCKKNANLQKRSPAILKNILFPTNPLIILVFLFPLHRSLDLDESPTQATPPTLPLLETKADEGTAASDASGGSQAAAKTSLEEVRLQQGPKEVNRTEVELQEFHQHHGRLLPNCKNAVHVIDGPERRYFVGIIDIFTVYNWRKKLEHLWKSVRYPGRDFSTVSPTKYSSRFCQWIQERSH